MAETEQKMLKVAGAATVLVSGGLVAVTPGQASANTFSANSKASLAAAINDANTNPGPDVINVAAGTILITGSALPTISDDVTIIGAGAANTVIDGDAVYRIFYLDGGATSVTISDLTLYNGFTSGYGGAISVSGPSLTLDGVVLANNFASGVGGALWWSGGVNSSLTITNSTFYSNYAQSSGGGFYAGPSDGNVTISGSSFDGNFSDSNSGAGRISGTGRAEIIDSTFSGNEAASYGGALYVTGGDLYLEIDGSTFTDNIVQGSEGGAIEAYDFSRMVIRNSVFTGNVAESSAGGAIYISGVYDGTLIENSLFAYNSADSEGGAIWADSHVEVVGSIFEHNSAYVAGAIYSQYSLDVTDSTFSGNTTDDDGGAIAADGYLTITQSTFSENSAGTYGGAIIAWEGAVLTVNNSTIAGNTAADAGGGVYLSSGVHTFNNTIISGNTVGGVPNDLQSHDVIDVGGNNNLITLVAPGTVPVGQPQASAAQITLTGTGNILGVDAMLGALGDNGGDTETMVPMSGSPALDAGDNSVSPGATDQRGAARVYKTTIDIGAVEATAEERGESLPPTGSGAEQAAWYAALMSGVGAVLTLGASRRRQQQS